MMPPNDELTLQEAADLLGVHYMTAYRYVRLGRLDAHRDGHQWRLSRAAVEGFGTAPPSGPAPDIAVDWADRLANRALAHDRNGAWSVVEAALVAGFDPARARSEILIPVLARFGEQWRAGELHIGTERGATNLCARIGVRLSQLESRPGRSKGTVVFGCPPSEGHQLPTILAADIFRAGGYEVVDAIGGLPPSAFAELVSGTTDVIAAALGVTMRSHRAEVEETIAALREDAPDCLIIVGGGGIDLDERLPAGADLYAIQAAEGLELLDQARIDLFRRPNGLSLGRAGSRPSGS